MVGAGAPTTTLAQFRKDEMLAQAEEVNKHTTETSKNLKKLYALTAEYFRQPLEHISLQKTWQEAKDIAADFGSRDLSKSDTGESSQDASKMYEAFIAELPSTGWTLSGDGCRRLLVFAICQHYLMNVALADLGNWARLFRRCVELGVFLDGEIGYDESLRTVPPESEPEPEEIPFEKQLDKIDTSTRAGERAAHELMIAHWSDAQRQMYRTFVDWEGDTYGVVVTPEMSQDALRFFTAFGKNPLNRKHWDELRLSWERRGITRGAVTPDEAAVIKLDSIDTSKYEGQVAARSAILKVGAAMEDAGKLNQ
jgi:hypothetical protein